jgi:hypothetical protein
MAVEKEVRMLSKVVPTVANQMNPELFLQPSFRRLDPEPALSPRRWKDGKQPWHLIAAGGGDPAQ